MNEINPNPLYAARHQLDVTAELLNLDAGIHEVLGILNVR